LSLLVDVLLGQVDSVLDSSDIFIGLVELVVFLRGPLEFFNHLPPEFDSLGDHSLELSGQLLELPLHVLDDFGLNAAPQFALDLDLLVGELCEVIVLLFELNHQSFNEAGLDLLVGGLLHLRNLPLHHADPVLPGCDSMQHSLVHSLGPPDGVFGVHLEHLDLVSLVLHHMQVSLGLHSA